MEVRERDAVRLRPAINPAAPPVRFKTPRRSLTTVSHKCGSKQRSGAYGKERGDIAEQGTAVDGSESAEDGGRDDGEGGESEIAAQVQALVVFAGFPHGFGGRYAGGFAGWDQGGKEGDGGASEDCGQRRSRGKRYGARGAGGEKSVHGVGDHAHDGAREKPAEADPEDGSQQSQQRRFAEEDQQNAPELVPTARRMPISVRRRTTLTAIVL